MTTPVPPPGTLVLLHGHDDDPAAAAESAGPMAGEAWNVVTPAGPVVTGDGRRAWWRSDDDGAPIPDDVAAATAVVDDVLARYTATGAPLILGGFSQGGALALALALRADPPPAVDAALTGAFAVGAWLPDLVGLDADLARAAARNLPVLIAHGTDDDAVPDLLGRSAAKLLDRHGIAVRYVALDVGHRLDPFAPAVADWVAAVARGELPADPP